MIYKGVDVEDAMLMAERTEVSRRAVIWRDAGSGGICLDDPGPYGVDSGLAGLGRVGRKTTLR